MALAFDTLRFMQRLEQAGVGREQAVAHAELARDMILADVATKADLADLATKADLASVRTDLTGLKSDLAAVRVELVGTKKEIDGSLRELELRMTVKLGAAVAVIAALQKFL